MVIVILMKIVIHVHKIVENVIHIHVILIMVVVIKMHIVFN